MKFLAGLLHLPDEPGHAASEEWVILEQIDWYKKEENEKADVLDFSTVGYHASALLLRAGLFQASSRIDDKAACIAFLRSSLNEMFPNNKDAPRLSDPSKRSSLVFYTPYFSTFTMAALLEAGEGDYVMEQYKTAWGWALEQSSTWPEVFDVRWEAVHSWGGCPTWQLSRYGLGLKPRFDIGTRHFELHLCAGKSLPGAEGAVPARTGERVEVSWARLTASTCQMEIKATTPIVVLGWPGATAGTWATPVGVSTATAPCT